MCFLRTVVFGQVFLVCKLYNKHLHNRCLKMGAVMQRMKLKLAGKDSSVQISKLKGGGRRRQISSFTYRVLGCFCFFSKMGGKFTIHLMLNPGLQDSLGLTSCTKVWQQSRQCDSGCIVVNCASTSAEHLSKKVLWCLSEVTVSLQMPFLPLLPPPSLVKAL